MRRRKKKKEGYRVIFLILIPIILIGGIGIFMLINNKSILKLLIKPMIKCIKE